MQCYCVICSVRKRVRTTPKVTRPTSKTWAQHETLSRPKWSKATSKNLPHPSKIACNFAKHISKRQTINPKWVQTGISGNAMHQLSQHGPIDTEHRFDMVRCSFGRGLRMSNMPKNFFSRCFFFFAFVFVHLDLFHFVAMLGLCRMQVGTHIGQLSQFY